MIISQASIVLFHILGFGTLSNMTVAQTFVFLSQNRNENLTRLFY